jgi:hypothetical protein
MNFRNHGRQIKMRVREFWIWFSQITVGRQKIKELWCHLTPPNTSMVLSPEMKMMSKASGNEALNREGVGEGAHR